MSYQLERAAIESYFIAQWAGSTPIGLDEQSFTAVKNSVRLTIKSGAVRQGSIGRISNRIDHIGIATFQIITDGALGSSAWRGYADTLMDMLHEKTIDSTGALITASAQAFVRFSPPQLGDNAHPYIGASFDAEPFTKTNVIAPFVRYTYR